MKRTKDQVEEINNFVRMSLKAGMDRTVLNALLKSKYGVRLVNRKYSKHTGTKQRLKNLIALGMTRDEALDKLNELFEEAVNGIDRGDNIKN